MFQVIFIFSDWILIRQIIVTSVLPFPLGRKHIFKKFYLEFWVGDWGTSKNASIQCIFNSINYILSKILQNDAKFIQKLAPGFKNHMKNLNNFTQAVESPKSWNLMGYYFCPKKIHLSKKCIPSAKTLYTEDFNFLFNYLCENSPNFLCHFWNHKLFSTTQLRLFRLATAGIKFHQISHVIFWTKSLFFFKLCIILQCHET